MRSLVIDQSTTVLGYSVVDDNPKYEIFPGLKGKLIEHGRIQTNKNSQIHERLITIRADLKTLIETFKVDEIVIEETRYYRQKSGDTAYAMSAIYKLIYDLTRDFGIGFYTQYPQTIKMNIGGHGKASKEELKKEVMRLLNLYPWQIKDDNHSDALAGAINWLIVGKIEREKPKTKKRKN